MKTMPGRGRSVLVGFFALLACLGICVLTPSQARVTGVPLATQDRLQLPGWWPTKGDPARNEYAGPDACAQCHALKAATQKTTPMARASTPAANAGILRQHTSLSFVSGPYTFKIAKTGNQPTYSVSDGAGSLSQPLDWAFGTGEVGQTYVFNRNGNFYESRVSFYPDLQALDLTLGHHAPAANDLAGALGRLMAGPEARLCFGCHSTASTTAGRFNVSGLIPGVTCEACHGPGARHVSAMQRKQIKLGAQAILNPARLNPVDAVDFCGACHRTTWDVALSNTAGVANVRFQPYRLEKSRCWGKGGSRLTCMACHDPHQPLVRDPAAYDNQCLSCHVSSSSMAAKNTAAKAAGDHPGKVCPVGTSKCVSCHMAKYEIPGSHAQFTDHWIRVVRSGTAYPD
jgi:hypothetical protein